MGSSLARLLAVASLLGALLSALAYFGELGWAVDLLAQFRFQALLGCGVLLLALLWLRRPASALVALVGAGLNAYALAAVPVSGAAASDAPPLRIVAFNLEGNDRRIDDVVTWLRAGNFDVVSLEELTPSFAAQLQALDDLYPFKLMEPRKGGFGIGLISRHPFLSQESLFSDSDFRRVLRVTIGRDGAPLEIIAIHPPPPLSASFAREHDATLNSLAALPANPRRIVMGDFNAAPTSLALRRLMAALDLHEASRWPRLSWTSDLPWPLRLPIDHVLVGSGLALDTVRNGPALGSDHFPQVAEVTIGKNTGNSATSP